MERLPIVTFTAETGEEKDSKVEKFLSKIKGFKDAVAQKLGLSGEKLTEMADEALVDEARETILNADQDGERTAEEAADIHDAVSSVVVQGAMEEGGYDQSSGENPILSLDQEGTEADLVASIATLHQEEVTLPTGEDVAELAVKAIEDAKWDRMVQVGRAEGTNDGGWYEYPSTGERYYVKFYRNPDQMRAEYVANAVYAKLGIKAVQSELVKINGRDGIASAKIEDARMAKVDDQQTSIDVQKGFVADAFLANWDVVGQAYDNIVKGNDGLHRIDNGGSFNFRARGGSKEYSPNDIPELTTMLNPNFEAGKIFGYITPRKIRDQAQYLLDNLSEDDIRGIVEESGLEGEERDVILNGMLGRRKVLEQLYGKPESEATAEDTETAERGEVVTDGRLSDKLRELHEQGAEQVGEYVIFPRGEISCDRDHIEGQKINLYDKTPVGRIEATFKLRGGTQEVYDKFFDQKDVQKFDAIACWHQTEGHNDPYALCGALSFKRGDVKVFIAEPDTNVRTAHGLIKIEAPSDMSPEEIEHAIADIMQNDLDIQEGTSEVPEESLTDYQENRYIWEHRIGDRLSEEQLEAAHRLEMAEVAPGYSTLIEPGKHEEYLAKYGESMRAYHTMYSGEVASVVAVLTSGLLCSSERYERGIYDDGMSTSSDLKTGGGDSVFTRVAPKEAAEMLMQTTVVFKPELFDRTDWYSYSSDQYGSTEEDNFRTRLTPDELFEQITQLKGSYNTTNEQMFRTGIAPKYIENIRVIPSKRDEILATLREKGITKVDGRPIEEIVVANENIIERTPDENVETDDWGDIDEIEQGLESQLQTAKQKEAILDGTGSYEDVSELFDLCETPDDLSALCNAIIGHGGGDKLKTDLSMFLINSIDLGDIKTFVHGALDPSHDVSTILKCAQDIVGVDLNTIIDTKVKWNKP